MRLPVCLMLCAVPMIATAEPTAEEWARVMNVSGRQRMLTQKMSKEALFVAAGVNRGKQKNDLTETMALFEKSLVGLRDGDPDLGLPETENPRIIKQLDKVRGLYEELKPVLDEVAGGAELSPEQLERLADLNPPLLKQMNKAVKMYERGAKKVLSGDDAAAVVINLAGKQRMLTQKMTKELLLVRLGVKADENRLNLRETASLFDRTLHGLAEGDSDLGLPGTDDSELRGQLVLIGEVWARVSPHIDTVIDGGELTEPQLRELSETNVKLLKEMNHGVKLFEQAAH